MLDDIVKIVEAANKALKIEERELYISPHEQKGLYSIKCENKIMEYVHENTPLSSVLCDITHAVINILKQKYEDIHAQTWEGVSENTFFVNGWIDNIHYGFSWTVFLNGEKVIIEEWWENGRRKRTEMSIEEYFETLVGIILLIRQVSKSDLQ